MFRRLSLALAPHASMNIANNLMANIAKRIDAAEAPAIAVSRRERERGTYSNYAPYGNEEMFYLPLDSTLTNHKEIANEIVNAVVQILSGLSHIPDNKNLVFLIPYNSNVSDAEMRSIIASLLSEYGLDNLAVRSDGSQLAFYAESVPAIVQRINSNLLQSKEKSVIPSATVPKDHHNSVEPIAAELAAAAAVAEKEMAAKKKQEEEDRLLAQKVEQDSKNYPASAASKKQKIKPQTDYFESYFQMGSREILERFKDGVDNLTIINATQQLLSSMLNIEVHAFALGPVVVRQQWSATEQLKTHLAHPQYRKTRYSICSFAANKGKHSLAILIDRDEKIIYCVDSLGINTEEEYEAKARVGKAIPIVSGLENFRMMTPEKMTPPQQRRQDNHCGIYTMRNLIGLILMSQKKEIDMKQYYEGEIILPTIDLQTGKGLEPISDSRLIGHWKTVAFFAADQAHLQLNGKIIARPALTQAELIARAKGPATKAGAQAALYSKTAVVSVVSQNVKDKRPHSC